MKKLIVTILGICLFLSSCKNNPTETEPNEAIQILADRSYAAKEFAAPLFADYMVEQNISNYIIKQTAYGFYTAETQDSVYIVGYLYSVNGSTDMYGYKIIVDENEICSVLEEGIDVALFLFSNADDAP